MAAEPTIYRVQVAIDIPEQVLKDLLVSCVEGGSNYWLCAKSIERDDQLNVLKIVQPSDSEYGPRRLKPFDPDQFTPDCDPKSDITLETVRRGIQRLLEGALPGRPDLMGQVLRIPSDTHDFDASDADVILQLGYFGTVVYG